MNALRSYVYYRKPIGLHLRALHVNYVIHRWRTLYGSHRLHFQCKSSHNRCRHCLYRHLRASSNVHHQRISTAIHLVSNHHTTSPRHRRISSHLSESASLRLISTTRVILCNRSANIYTEFERRRRLFIN